MSNGTEGQLTEEAGHMQNEVFRVKEFCKRYAISRTSFYREVAASRLAVFKRGRTTLVMRSEAERWLRALAYLRTREAMDKRYSAALVKST